MEGALTNIEVDIEDAEGSVYLVRVETSFGPIKLLGAVTIAVRAMMVDRLHFQGLKPGVLGRSGLNAVARESWTQPMSTPLSFKARPERQANDPDKHRSSSASGADYRLTRHGVVVRPVDLARTLKGLGLTLSEAHRVLDAILADGMVTVALTGVPAVIVSQLRDHGLDVDAMATEPAWRPLI